MRRPTRTLISLSAACLLGAVSYGFATPTGGLDLLSATACTDHPAPQEVTVTSQAGGIAVDTTVFRPCSASAATPVPIILHSHGWSGSKSTSGFGTELDAGFGVVSITQRGHGDSGGQANVQDPELEAQDIKSVIDHVASFDWVRLDRDDDGVAIPGDPVLFAMGGSYGGGYQTITALTEVRESGRTRFNALAPEITWFDLPQSLAPNGVVRSEWNTVLYGAGAALVDLAPFIHEAFAWGSTTGDWPDGTVKGEPDPTGVVPDIDRIFHAHSPVAFVEQGHQLDVPVLWRQGITDTLFNLNEGLHTFDEALTEKARSRSLFVGYNGGHVLPTVYPTLRNDGALSGSDTCSFDGFGSLRLAFFRAVAEGEGNPARALQAANDGLRRYNLMTDDGTGCVRLDALPGRVAHTVGQDVDLVVEQVDDSWATPTGVGPAIHLEIAGGDGPVSVAGIAVLSGDVAAVGVDQRAFFGLSRGTSPEDAQLIQANLSPLQVFFPTADVTQPFRIELPGVAVELAEGEKLFLTVTPFSEQFYGHGSTRTPGVMAFTDLTVELPVVGAEADDAGNGKGHGKGGRP